jgi:hypothetical protein
MGSSTFGARLSSYHVVFGGQVVLRVNAFLICNSCVDGVLGTEGVWSRFRLASRVKG